MKPIVIIAIAVVIGIIAVVGHFANEEYHKQQELEVLENAWYNIQMKFQQCSGIILDQFQNVVLSDDFTEIDRCNNDLHELRIQYDIMDLKYQGYSQEQIKDILEEWQNEIEISNHYWKTENVNQINSCKSTYIGQPDMQNRCIEKVNQGLASKLQEDYLK